MVGDIAYGAIILVFALVMKKIYKTEIWLQHIMDILVISSIPSIIFGFLFGEFFGNFGEDMGWIHPITFLGITWNRIEAIVPLLVLAIAIGVFHVLLGLIIGIFNALAKKSKKHAIEKAGMIGIVIGILLVFGAVLEMIPSILIQAAVVIIIIALAMIIYGGGFFGAFEIMSTAVNILSYARLMAIGMASVVLALVANRARGNDGHCCRRVFDRRAAPYSQYCSCDVLPVPAFTQVASRGIPLQILRGGREDVQTLHERERGGRQMI